MDTCTALTRRVNHLKFNKVAQALEITKLKRRVKKLERRNKGRMIAEMDQDADVVLNHDKEVADEAKEEDETEPAEVQEVVDVVTTAKLITEVVTTTSETNIAAIIRDLQEESTTSIIIPAETKSKDKGKGILVDEPKPLKKKQQIKQDKQYARELQAELNKNIDWDEAIDHVKKKAKEDPVVKRYQMDYFKGMSYDDIRLIFEAKFNTKVAFLLKTKEHIEENENRALKRLNETPAKRAAKRQKLDEELKELKRHIQIVPNEDDDVYTEATSLARKVLVVDYQIIELNNKPYYKIIRADDTRQFYTWSNVRKARYTCLDLENSEKCTWSSKGQRMEAIGMWCADHNIYIHPADFVSREEVPTHKIHSRPDAKCVQLKISLNLSKNQNEYFIQQGGFSRHQVLIIQVHWNSICFLILKIRLNKKLQKQWGEPTIERYMTKTQDDYGSAIARLKFDEKAHFELKDMQEVILFYKGLDVPTRQILDSKGVIPSMKATDAKKAIQDMADHSQKWHNRKSTKAKSTDIVNGLAVIQAQLNNIGREIKKVNDIVYRAATLGFYQRDNGNPLYQERRKTMEELLNAVILNQRASIKALEIQISQMSKVLQEKGSGSLPSSTKTNPRDHVKLISTTIETDTPLIRHIDLVRYAVLSPQNKMQFFKPSRLIIPFPNRLIDDYYKQIEGLEELMNGNEYASNLKRLIKEKMKMGYQIEASMNVLDSAILEDSIPLKKKDPWSFTIPFYINNICFENALANLGASISVMPYLTFTNLGFIELATTKLIIKLADRTIKRPKELRRNQVEDLGPTIEEGEVIDEPMEDIVKTRNDDNGINEYPIMENVNAYRDEGMGDVIVGKPFGREIYVKARRFDGMITIYNSNDGVTYQMVHSHP
nr:hypothetical protein [Tanacetum cinerariifolium]